MRIKRQPQTGTGKSSARSNQQTAGTLHRINLHTQDLSEPVLVALGDEWLSAQAVATGIESCTATVLRAFRKGELTGHKLSARLVRFRRSDVITWLNRARVGTPLTRNTTEAV